MRPCLGKPGVHRVNDTEHELGSVKIGRELQSQLEVALSTTIVFGRLGVFGEKEKTCSQKIERLGGLGVQLRGFQERFNPIRYVAESQVDPTLGDQVVGLRWIDLDGVLNGYERFSLPVFESECLGLQIEVSWCLRSRWIM